MTGLIIKLGIKYMRIFLSIFILIFSFQSWAKANDIRDFEIEGISIGDSLLDYYSVEEIKKSSRKTNYPKKNNVFLNISIFTKTGNYDALKFYVKINDENYKIYSIEGRKRFSIVSKCREQMKNITKELENLLEINNKREHIFNYPQYIKTKAYVTELELDKGRVRLWCDDFSKEEIKKSNPFQGLGISINSEIFMNYILDVYS